MRRRMSSRFDKPKIKAVPVKSSPLVTLEDPQDGTESARGAFARLVPPEGLPEEQIDSWRQSVEAVAKAVKVLPQPKSDEVPVAASRIDEGDKVGTIREEAIAIARETGKEEVVKQTESLLDEVGA